MILSWGFSFHGHHSNLRVQSSYGVTPCSSCSNSYIKILPLLKPRPILNGATLLGAHIEGPYLQASKNGAHNSALFQQPSVSPTSFFGSGLSNVKLVTLAPELPNSLPLIKGFLLEGIKVSLGHSAATYAEGLSAITAGATCLTHILNAMSPLHHREPGLAGLISLPEFSKPPPPYFSILGDGIHLHPTVATILWRAAPHRAIVVSDSIELAGLPDGVYPGNAQIPHPQVKVGPRATIQGTDTLIGACCTVAQAVPNLIKWSGCGVAEAVRCLSENVVTMMGVEDQFGTLKEGRRADFVVLEEDGSVRETWIGGRRVWSRSEGFQSWSPHD